MRTVLTSRAPRLTGVVAATAAIALLGSACSPDGSDAHLAGGAEPEETEPAGAADEESGDDEADSVDGETADSADEAGDTGDSSAEDEAAEAPAETVPPNGEVVAVLAIDNSFIEEVVEIEAGTEVYWKNNGRNDHDVIPVDPDADWGIEIEDFPANTGEYRHVFTTPGEYPYFCTIHGTETVGMTGTIIVTG